MDSIAPSAAERLLDTAARLFYARGVSNVGINEIIERAGVARMTLYHHFPSKDALVRAVLEQRRDERAAWLAQADGLASEPRGRMLAVFDLLEAWTQMPDFRGCPLLAAGFELGGQFNTALVYAREHLGVVREFFAARAREAGFADPDGLAAQLQLLLDGASSSALIQGNASAAAAAKAAAAALIDRQTRSAST